MSTHIPFPLASGRYEVGPAMRRFGQSAGGAPAETGHFLIDHELQATLAAKLAVLRKAPNEAHLFAPDLSSDQQSGLHAAMLAAFRLVADEHPEMVTAGPEEVTLHHLGVRLVSVAGSPHAHVFSDGWPSLGPVVREIQAHLAGREGLGLLGDALGLSVQEDLAIVHAAAGSDVLEWVHVCLPSNWAPAEKIGRSFAAVHQPVVHSERLLASQAQIVRAMIQGGPFVRYVWAIHRDAELCHNPRIHQSAPWRAGAAPEDLARQAFFRVERQTTHGFPELDRALFTIRYYVEPLAVTASDPWQRERLASALAQMDQQELSYKGLTPARDGLVAWLTR